MGNPSSPSSLLRCQHFRRQALKLQSLSLTDIDKDRIALGKVAAEDLFGDRRL
jgi:hypothetical protein